MIRKVTSWINKLFKSEKPTASPSKMAGDVCMEGDKAIYSAGVGKRMNCIPRNEHLVARIFYDSNLIRRRIFRIDALQKNWAREVSNTVRVIISFGLNRRNS
jgi:hypothetical protein